MEGPNPIQKSFATPGGEEFLQRFPTPKINESDEDLAIEADLFAQASHNLISEKMFTLFVRAISDKEISGSNDNLALLQNKIIQECVNLSENDTVLVLNRFNRSVREWFLKKYSPSSIDSRVYRRILRGMHATDEGKNDIHIEKGVQNVISFLKTRARLLEASPTQEYNHYFSSKLDARHGIDVIEEIDGEDGLEISLFQIKSSPPTSEEILDIHKEHEEWVKEGWMDLAKYEESYIGEGTEYEISRFMKNKYKVEDALLEFCTDPENQSLEHLFASLRFSELNSRQQAWMLWKYIDLLKKQLDAAVTEGAVEAEMRDHIWKELSALKENLNKKARLPKSQSVVSKVKSVISVGARIVSERELGVDKSGKVMNIR